MRNEFLDDATVDPPDTEADTQNLGEWIPLLFLKTSYRVSLPPCNPHERAWKQSQRGVRISRLRSLSCRVKCGFSEDIL